MARYTRPSNQQVQLGALHGQLHVVPDAEIARHPPHESELYETEVSRTVHLGNGRPKMLRPILLTAAWKMDEVKIRRVLGTHDESGVAVTRVQAHLEAAVEVRKCRASVKSACCDGGLIKPSPTSL